MDINRYIDHTLLKADATTAEIDVLIDEAIQYNFRSVCIQPTFVAHAAKRLAGTTVDVCTVIGFPLGANTPETKRFEAVNAIEHGASEIDMVINIGALKEGRYAYVRDEIDMLKQAVGTKVLKVIIETSLLTDEEIVKASTLVVEAGADFVKTSTGFSTGGATVNDVMLMKKTVGDRAEVKASGGVRSLEDLNEMVAAGATRIGASAGVSIMEGLTANVDY